MNLRSVEEVPDQKIVILKMDLDVPMHQGKVTDVDRLKKSIPTIQLLLKKHCHIVVIGHCGRPKEKDSKYSLLPVYEVLMELIESELRIKIHHRFISDFSQEQELQTTFISHNVVMLENLRFWEGEENNDPKFLRSVVQSVDCFVNDALATAHRRHRSTMLYKELPAYYGLAFIHEVENLYQIINNPQKPITVLLGGAKEDKLSYVQALQKTVDYICIGGKLPLYIKKSGMIMPTEAVFIATLREDARDISDDDISYMNTCIKKSRTIIWIGAMGMFEEEDAKKGTREIAKSIGSSGAYTIIAGGDTEASVSDMNVESTISLIASGGGMLLELLTKGSLPAWES